MLLNINFKGIILSTLCPCGSDLSYQTCCSPLHKNEQKAATAQALMRSRYSAYVVHDADYLIATWHSDCQAQLFKSEIESGFEKTQWLGLHVIACENGSHPDEAFVEFSACFIERNNEDKQLIHERSRFLRIDNEWFYIDGVNPKVGRNDHCPCGSGKKYKKCCA